MIWLNESIIMLSVHVLLRPQSSGPEARTWFGQRRRFIMGLCCAISTEERHNATTLSVSSAIDTPNSNPTSNSLWAPSAIKLLKLKSLSLSLFVFGLVLLQPTKVCARPIHQIIHTLSARNEFISFGNLLSVRLSHSVPLISSRFVAKMS